jgi:rRNA maturation endonuclease Nob1
MKEEFLNLVNLWSISKKEGEQLEKKYDSIENLKQALENNDVDILNNKDIKKLKDYFNISNTKNCSTCGKQLPKNLDMGICPNCGHRKRPW